MAMTPAKTRVAVIGAGAAGLTSARHMSTAFECHVFERGDDVGGTWRISEEIGVNKHGLPVHSSLYKNLRTNLPKEIMFFPDFPVPDVPESYIKAELVLKYLEDYADHFNLRPLIHFNHLVQNLRPTSENSWEIDITDLDNNVTFKQTFDAIMVCNGHYFEPSLPVIEGSSDFTGLIMHSHDYREPETFTGQRVLVIGAGPSGMDITVELAECAEEVVMSHHKKKCTEFPANVRQVLDVDRLVSRGAIFTDDTYADLDTIICCTGYKYCFPFMNESCGIKITENGVVPLYHQFIHIDRPSMCILGLQNNVVPFPLVDLQARYFKRVLEGELMLPKTEDMHALASMEQEQRKSEGLVGVRMAHYLGPKQKDYFDTLATEANIEPVPHVVSHLHAESRDDKVRSLYTYRDYCFKIIDNETFVRVKE